MVPPAPVHWDDFEILDPAAYPQKGGFVAEKKLTLLLNHVLPSANPADPQWVRYELAYDITGKIEFSRKGLNMPDRNWTPAVPVPDRAQYDVFVAPSWYDLTGLRLFTKQDVVTFVAALHKYDSWSAVATSKGMDNAAKEIARTRRYIYTFVVTNHAPSLRVTKLAALELAGTREPLIFSDGNTSHDFTTNEVRLFEFFMSKIKELQEKMAAEKKADPFR